MPYIDKVIVQIETFLSLSFIRSAGAKKNNKKIPISSGFSLIYNLKSLVREQDRNSLTDVPNPICHVFVTQKVWKIPCFVPKFAARIISKPIKS